MVVPELGNQSNSHQNRAAGTREPVIIPPCCTTMLRYLTPPFVLEINARWEQALRMPLQLLVAKKYERTVAVAP